MKELGSNALIVVSRDLPIQDRGQLESVFHRGSTPGNRIEAITAAMHQQTATWVGGWHGPGSDEDGFTRGRFTFEPVVIADEGESVEGEFSSQTLWPLYHDIIAHPDFPRAGWEAYQDLNRRFADRILEVSLPNSEVWLLDHHLQLVPAMLRAARSDLRIGFFLDIPFPPLELLYHLPWHRRILEGLLGADLVGFQAVRHQQNFVEAVQAAFGHPSHPAGLHLGSRHLRTGTYPLSVDTATLRQLATEEEVDEEAKLTRARLGDPELLMLAFDPLDCTAGIIERLRAFEELVREKEIDPHQTVLVQIATTSPDQDGGQCAMRDDIDRLVGRINGDAARYGHPPVIYVHSTGSDTRMAALYRAADILLCTPLRDGMSLSAKEYVACRVSDDGAVVLSTLSGAAQQLTSAYHVNPYDLGASKIALLRAIRDSPEQRAARMRPMRQQVVNHDLRRWSQRFLRELASRTREIPCPNPSTERARDLRLLRDQLKGAPLAGGRWQGYSQGGSSPIHS